MIPFPLLNSKIYVFPHISMHSCRTVPLCSSVPTSWTRRTSLASLTLSWSSTEAMRMERKCLMLFFFLILSALNEAAGV